MPAKTLESPKPGGSAADSDARAELGHLTRDLERSTLEVAWRQWKALGASAALRAHGSRRLQSLIDPEALLLVSLLLMEDEPRLRDIMPDWMIVNSDLLSVQRVKNLAKGYPDELRRPLSDALLWLAKITLHEGKDLRWKSLVDPTHAGSRTRRKESGKRTDLKRRAVRARTVEPATLLLRLRLGLGVGVKADLISYLLGRGEEWVSVREIADATGYTPAGVRRAAEDLAAARLVLSIDEQPSAYRADRAAWTALLALDGGAPVWQNWHQRFIFATAFAAWARRAESHTLTTYAFGVCGRELMERYRPAFDHSFFSSWSMHTDVPDWAAFVKRAVQSLSAWMIEMA